MTIFSLLCELKQLADTLPNGVHSQVVAWVRVPNNTLECSVLEVSSVQQGHRESQGGEIATLCLDAKA